MATNDMPKILTQRRGKTRSRKDSTSENSAKTGLRLSSRLEGHESFQLETYFL